MTNSEQGSSLRHVDANESSRQAMSRSNLKIGWVRDKGTWAVGVITVRLQRLLRLGFQDRLLASISAFGIHTQWRIVAGRIQVRTGFVDFDRNYSA